MSAGAFIATFYAADSDLPNIYPIRVQPETIAATVTSPLGAEVANTPDAGPATVQPSAQVSGSTRRNGLHARKVYLSLTGTPPTGYAELSRTSIPCLSLNFFVNCRKRAVVTYLGTTWRVTGRRAEVIR